MNSIAEVERNGFYCVTVWLSMARSKRENVEKAKVKFIFRLQFHASHIPQPGWNNLFISVIPSDSGKATAKTNKANVRNGTCKWVDPIYETTKLLQDSKTKQYEEKLYKLLVAMGTSRSSLLGVANINLSAYVDASGTNVVALPLQGSNSRAILHVTVQLLTSKTGFREFEQQKEVGDRDLSANTYRDGGQLSTVEEATVSRAAMANPKIIFKPDSKEESGYIEGYADSAAGFHGLSNTLGSLYAEKHENSSDHGTITISSDIRSVSPSQSPPMNKGKSDNHSLVRCTSQWVHQWGPDTSVDQEMAIVYEENNRLKGDLKAADLSMHELRKEIASLQSFAYSLGVQAQKLTEQIAVEITSEQNLAEQVSVLKSECLKFRGDLEFLRKLKLNSDNNISDTVLVPEFCHPKGILVTSETSSVESNKVTQEEINKIPREMDEAKLEQENLVRKMDEMECYYKGIIQDLEVKQRQLLDELQNLRHEHSSCIYTFPSIKAEMEAMHQQNCRLSAHNKDLEQRAANSEDALRRTRMNYSSTVDQLQKDLELLSLQVLSMFETNETLIGKALSEASQPSFQDTDENQNMESQLPSVIKNHHVGSSRLLKDVKSLDESPEDLCMKMQEELSEMHLANINLNIFSVTLHQVLLEASLSIANEICTPHENKAVSDFISSDLALENQTLDGKLRNFNNEKCILSDKIRELESLVDHYKNYKSKYEDCDAENANLLNQLEQVATGNHHLSNEVSILKEEMMTMKIKISESEKFQQMVSHIKERLEKLLGIGEDGVNGLPPCSKEERNIGCDKLRNIVMHLEDCLQNFNDKILQLMKENKILLNERNIARASFANAEARVMGVKQKFEHDVQDIVSKLNESSGLAEKLQTGFFEIEELKSLLRNSETEIEDLIFSKEELETRLLVVQATVDEISAQISSHEKRKVEGSSYASRETLRIAFIKEQYETELQEIRHQLSISEKHGEEMLRKLQDSVDDLQNTKKREASQMKRNEELLLKIAELEIELHMVLSDNCEKLTAYEQMKVELDCSTMSLDCCKDGKNQLLTSLKECNDYKCKLGDEVELLREQPENHKASMRHVLINPQTAQREVLVTTAAEELSDWRNSEKDVKHNEDLLNLNNQLKPYVLLSIIERFQKELEQMTSENTLLSGDENPDDLVGEVSQRDQVHLEKVSEELESMSSLHNDSLRRRHTMEKELTLELELADTSSLKKNSSIQFQSSVLKLPSNEAAVLQSFRNMLEMKERYCAMETELKGMHERYSQLSLDFAEVEGERQKLMLMLKNARPSKKGS